MRKLDDVLALFSEELSKERKMKLVAFVDFLEIVKNRPSVACRNIFQYARDMIMSHVGVVQDEYPDDPESIGFVDYTMDDLFAKDVDVPFFPDRLFKNRFMQIVDSLGINIGQNRVYTFEGPHGCGKSTFINNLLRKLEKYSFSDDGERYEVVWKIDVEKLGGYSRGFWGKTLDKDFYNELPSFLEIPCPNHCNPILLIPMDIRKEVISGLIEDDEMRKKVLSEPEFQWLFKDKSCTICDSLLSVLHGRLSSSEEALKMIYARRFQMSRRLGVGTVVYNPPDEGSGRNIVKNKTLQTWLNALLGSSNLVRLEYAKYGDSNNGVFVLMDLKDQNKKRFIDLHNVLSESYFKVKQREESACTLFLAIMNPEDEKSKGTENGISEDMSFEDRKRRMLVNYVLDYKTEVRIFEQFFGKSIRDKFLPRVLENFAKAVIASRLKDTKSRAISDWIKEKGKYKKYCDKDLYLLKMDIYTGKIPEWLSEEDRRGLTKKVRRHIIDEGENEGVKGFSGRESLKIFQELLLFYPDEVIITMEKMFKFFNKQNGNLSDSLPDNFLNALMTLYNYSVLQEVKESLYDYNEEQIKEDVCDYLFALSYEEGEVVNPVTNNTLKVDDVFFKEFERKVFGHESSSGDKTQSSRTAGQRRLVEEMSRGVEICDTDLFSSIYEHFIRRLKDNVLDPFLNNDNFRKAILSFGQDEFETYDKKIKRDVSYMIGKLQEKFKYNEKSAREVCVYVIENRVAEQFAS